ncbi:MAG: OmpA family protein [Aquificaceae bacterium]
MKKLALILFGSTIIFAQDFFHTRILEDINQVQRSIELAKAAEADKEDPYHFEKARANRDVAHVLASTMDHVGAKIFLVKSFSASSKALSGEYQLDEIGLIGKETDLTKGLSINLNLINSKLSQAREDKALSCAPVELARAEVYYDALLYELSKVEPNPTHLADFYEKSNKEVNTALEKIEIAKKGNLECYTGKPFVPELARVTEVPKLKETVVEEVQVPREPLMVAAKVNFDFNKHSIKREYIPLLKEVVKTLKENPNIKVRIEGFTDNIGSKAYNDKLALRRAQAVRDYLVKAGIPADRIEVAGFGKERYIANNTTSIGRLINRRAEFIVIQVPGQ